MDGGYFQHGNTTDLPSGGNPMAKTKMGFKTFISPLPALLIGTMVDDKPNFMTVGWAGIACSEPPMISVAIRHSRFTMQGIQQNRAFSVNVPSAGLVKEVDLCGSASGSKVNKVELCRFNIFYGALKTAPLIEQCPVNLECKVEHILNLGTHALVVGRIEETHVSHDCLTDGHPDVNKINPIIFSIEAGNHYYHIGQEIKMEKS
jgi:flavin reductase (DIM6/NTAB) family NADH-FMN oxidoreductase RutF